MARTDRILERQWERMRERQTYSIPSERNIRRHEERQAEDEARAAEIRDQYLSLRGGVEEWLAVDYAAVERRVMATYGTDRNGESGGLSSLLRAGSREERVATQRPPEPSASAAETLRGLIAIAEQRAGSGVQDTQKRRPTRTLSSSRSFGTGFVGCLTGWATATTTRGRCSRCVKSSPSWMPTRQRRPGSGMRLS